MNTCAECHKPLGQERVTLTLKLLGIAFCEACMMGKKATMILAGLAERRRTENWSTR